MISCYQRAEGQSKNVQAWTPKGGGGGRGVYMNVVGLDERIS